MTEKTDVGTIEKEESRHIQPSEKRSSVMRCSASKRSLTSPHSIHKIHRKKKKKISYLKNLSYANE